MVSVIQNFDQIFTDDYENGWLEQIFLNENTKYIYIFSKCLCLYIINLIPLLIVCPIAFILLDIPIKILPFFLFNSFHRSWIINSIGCIKFIINNWIKAKFNYINNFNFASYTSNYNFCNFIN